MNDIETNIKTISNKVDLLLKCDTTLQRIKIKCNVIKNKEWSQNNYKMYFLELQDATGNIGASVYGKNILEKINEKDELMIYGYASINKKNEVQITITSYTILNKNKIDIYTTIFNRLEKEKILDIPKKNITDKVVNLGIITSITSAALKDCLKILKKNMSSGNIYIYNSVMQGFNMVNNIIKCIKQANRNKLCDVLLVTRGGGSIEDLSWFNNYDLAIEVKKSNIPIACGIGHEIDVTIIDDVSDKCFITPTEASDELTKGHIKYNERISVIKHRYNSIINFILNKIDRFDNKLSNFTDNVLINKKKRLSKTIFKYNIHINNYSNYVKFLTDKLEKYNPNNILKEQLRQYEEKNNKCLLKYKSIVNIIINKIENYNIKILLFLKNIFDNEFNMLSSIIYKYNNFINLYVNNYDNTRYRLIKHNPKKILEDQTKKFVELENMYLFKNQHIKTKMVQYKNDSEKYFSPKITLNKKNITSKTDFINEIKKNKNKIKINFIDGTVTLSEILKIISS